MKDPPSTNKLYVVYIQLWLESDKMFTKNRISLNMGTLNWGFTVNDKNRLKHSSDLLQYRCIIMAINSIKII